MILGWTTPGEACNIHGFYSKTSYVHWFSTDLQPFPGYRQFLDPDFRVVGGGPTGVEVAADLADFLAGDAVEALRDWWLDGWIPTCLSIKII